MINIKLIIEYDGTNYVGWQRQPQGLTIQEIIENALGEITGEEITLYGSGRTDSGVHALAQVTNFKTDMNIDSSTLQKGLNSILPKDISIINAESVDPEFHSQYSAQSKIYIYKILNRPYPSALNRQRAWFMSYPLCVNSIIHAAEYLLGEHDFKAFTHTSTYVKSTVRRVLDVSVVREGQENIEITIEANGFLKRMVRLIVGTLVQVGKERITPKDFKEILDSGEKTKFVYAAPAHGLYLKEVKY